MSATNRGSEREKLDQYPTPPWCVDRLLEALPLATYGKDWLEPCAGSGSIIQAVNSSGLGTPNWSACEIDDEYEDGLRNLVGEDNLCMGDFFANTTATWEKKPFDVVITNPPYGLALEFVKRCFLLAPMVIMLLRLNFLESEERSAWMQAHPPDVYVLPNRPSFVKGGSDNCAYGWLVWHTDVDMHCGCLRILNSTPLAVRKLKG